MNSATENYIDVAAAERQTEARRRVGDEEESDVLVAVALQVAENAARIHRHRADEVDGFAVALLLQVELRLTTPALQPSA